MRTDPSSAPNASPETEVLPSRYGSEVYKQGLALYKRQSLPLFLLAFGEIAFGFLVPLILPIFLKVVVYFVTPVISIGVLRCLRAIDQSEKPLSVSEMFGYFYDDSRRKDYVPLCVIALIAGVLPQFTSNILGLGGLAMLVINALVAIAFFYGVPLVEFNRMPAKEALQLSLTTTTRNWKSLTVFGLLYVLYACISLVSLGIGFLFLIPIATAARFYFWQTSFDPEGAKLSAELNSRGGSGAVGSAEPRHGSSGDVTP